jgi:hypothetical protein
MASNSPAVGFVPLSPGMARLAQGQGGVAPGQTTEQAMLTALQAIQAAIAPTPGKQRIQIINQAVNTQASIPTLQLTQINSVIVQVTAGAIVVGVGAFAWTFLAGGNGPQQIFLPPTSIIQGSVSVEAVPITAGSTVAAIATVDLLIY